MSMVLCVWLLMTSSAATEDFEARFEDRTMRVDYHHTGTRGEEHFSVDRIVADGLWAGSRSQLLDSTRLGKYLFEVRDAESQQVLYSRGFSSIYGEWETTEPAKTRWGTFHESFRFPWPKAPIRIVLHKRNAKTQKFDAIWSRSIDPAAREVNTATPLPRGRAWRVLNHGPAHKKVDVVFLGDGYTKAELPAFQKHVRTLTDVLFSFEPFKSRKQDFNVWAVDSPARQSGVSRPHAGVYRHSPIGASYSTFDSERYVLTRDNRALRDIAAAAPYDFLVILVNERTYGGGGIYRDQTTLASRHAFTDYLLVHEFGHHFAGLGDEYYTSDVAYQNEGDTIPEPWAPNLTALHDPKRLKWKELLDADTPVPTPWSKDAFEAQSRAVQQQRRELRAQQAPEEKLEALFRKERETMTRLLAANQYAGRVGAFEGGGYQAKGIYRPSVDCIMFTRDEVGFCPVCRAAIVRVIDQYAQ